MRQPKHPAYMFRDWPDHAPNLIAEVDALARQLSPAWTPEKVLMRWVWRKAFELYHTALAPFPKLRSLMPWSPLVPLSSRNCDGEGRALTVPLPPGQPIEQS
jgi:hypothetical protein